MTRKRAWSAWGGVVTCSGRLQWLVEGVANEARSSLTVTVQEAAGPRVCGADPVHDGAFSLVLMNLGDALSCTYSGLRRPGNYSIEVVVGSRSKTVQDIAVTSGECHVEGRAVTITLD